MTSWIEKNNEVKIMKDGKYQLEKDAESARDYMINYVNKNTWFFHSLREKIDFMIENDYWDKELLDLYSFEQIKKVFAKAYDYKFRFPSYMSAFKFYNNYALKTDDGKTILERYEDRIAILALYNATLYNKYGHRRKMFKKAMAHVDVLMEQDYQPATPTTLNAGITRGGEKVSCFLIDVMDSTEGIEYACNASAQLSRRGGGVGKMLSLCPL